MQIHRGIDYFHPSTVRKMAVSEEIQNTFLIYFRLRYKDILLVHFLAVPRSPLIMPSSARGRLNVSSLGMPSPKKNVASPPEEPPRYRPTNVFLVSRKRKLGGKMYLQAYLKDVAVVDVEASS
ncbi:hypothetical protein L6452_35350 [Arctium lappa]|uniref:Uncharacterized protein n=1 Tax=Arctium lappa TaxID=4217 RepID=A0ACB8Y5G4_ARCLA|nr:hypothetical protein L6452_35350 [Arctium lappa]